MAVDRCTREEMSTVALGHIDLVLSVTGQIEVAGGEVRERTTEEIIGAQVTRSPTGTF